MGLSLQQLRDSLREHLGLDDVDLSNTDADLLLNRSWWQIADDYDFKEKETSRVYNLTPGVGEYAVALDLSGLQQVSIKDRYNGQHAPLEPITPLVYEQLYVARTDIQKQPTYYTRRGTSIIYYPVPDYAYEVKEYYWKTLADILVSGPPIPQSWHEVILYGSVYRGFAQRGDYTRSRAAKLMQAELMGTKESTNTKEHGNTQYASVQAIRPRYR